MSDPINPISPLVAPIVQPYQSYLPTAFSDDLSLLQKVNYLINYLGTVTNTVNSALSTINDFASEIDTDVVNQLTTWNSDGTLANIINQTVFNTLNTQINDIAYDIKNYGVKGDGVTDDTSAIQTAIHSGNKVYFPPGTYLISSTLLVDNSFPTELWGYKATLKANSDIDLMRLKNNTHHIHGITFDGTGRSSGLGIIVEGTSQYSLIEKNIFTNVPGSAINVQQGADHTVIQNNKSDSCGIGTSVSSPFNSTVYVADANSVKIIDNQFLNCAWGVYFRGTTEINNYLCEGNHITCYNHSVTSLQGISNMNAKMGQIVNNHIENFSDNAIDTNGCSYMVISGNAIETCQDGVFVGDNASKHITITGNVIRGCVRGVRIYNTDGNQNQLILSILVTGNTIEASTNEGILASCTGTGSQMSRLVISDNTITITGGTNGIKLDNVGQSNVNNNRISESTLEGIALIGCEMVQVVNNIVQDAGSSGGTYDGITLDSTTTRCILDNNIIYGKANNALSNAGTSNTIKGTRWRSTTAGINNTGDATNTLSDNVAF